MLLYRVPWQRPSRHLWARSNFSRFFWSSKLHHIALTGLGVVRACGASWGSRTNTHVAINQAMDFLPQPHGYCPFYYFSWIWNWHKMHATIRPSIGLPEVVRHGVKHTRMIMKLVKAVYSKICRELVHYVQQSLIISVLEVQNNLIKTTVTVKATLWPYVCFVKQWAN